MVTTPMETLRDHNSLPLTIYFLHGEGLKNTNPCTAMEVYVKAYIINGGVHKNTTIQKTTIDKRNGTNPIWNSKMKFNLNHKKLLEQGSNHPHHQTLELVLQVKSASQIGVFGNRKLGEVRLPVKSLYERVAAEDMVAGWTSIKCPVVGGSGRYKGAIYLSYRFGIYEEVVVQFGRDDAGAASAPPLPSVGI